MSTLYFLQALSRLLAESYHKGSGCNSEEVGEEGGAVGQAVAISTQQKQNTLEGSFKKRIANALSHGRQTGVKNTSSVNTVKNLEQTIAL